MSARIWAALLVAVLAIGMGGVFILSLRSTSVTRSTFVSPNGLFAATLEVHDGGAGVSPSAKVVLHDVKGAIGDGDIEIFDGVGGWPVALHWTGRQSMVLSFCRGNRYKARAHIPFNDPATQSVEEVTLAVVTRADTRVGGNAYCSFPPSREDQAEGRSAISDR